MADKIVILLFFFLSILHTIKPEEFSVMRKDSKFNQKLASDEFNMKNFDAQIVSAKNVSNSTCELLCGSWHLVSHDTKSMANGRCYMFSADKVDQRDANCLLVVSRDLRNINSKWVEEHAIRQADSNIWVNYESLTYGNYFYDTDDESYKKEAEDYFWKEVKMRPIMNFQERLSNCFNECYGESLNGKNCLVLDLCDTKTQNNSHCFFAMADDVKFNSYQQVIESHNKIRGELYKSQSQGDKKIEGYECFRRKVTELFADFEILQSQHVLQNELAEREGLFTIYEQNREKLFEMVKEDDKYNSLKDCAEFCQKKGECVIFKYISGNHLNPCQTFKFDPCVQRILTKLNAEIVDKALTILHVSKVP